MLFKYKKVKFGEQYEYASDFNEWGGVYPQYQHGRTAQAAGVRPDRIAGQPGHPGSFVSLWSKPLVAVGAAAFLRRSCIRLLPMARPYLNWPVGARFAPVGRPG